MPQPLADGIDGLGIALPQLAMLDWLHAAGCTHVAMESTSSYWRPVYNLLEGYFTLLVGNAYHMKTVPGRKTDVKDAEWIARSDVLRPNMVCVLLYIQALVLLSALPCRMELVLVRLLMVVSCLPPSRLAPRA